MLIPTEAIATAPAISSTMAISSAPASSSAPAGLPVQKPPSLWESPDPSSRNPPSTVPTDFPLAIPERITTRLTRKGGYPQIGGGGGGCHSSLGSSGDIIISHSGVSCSYRNVPHASVSRYTTSPEFSGLHRPPSRTLLHQNGSFPSRPTPRSERLVCGAPAHPRTISLYGSSVHNNVSEPVYESTHGNTSNSDKLHYNINS